MTRKELLEIQDFLFDRAVEIMTARNKKYAKEDHALMNFEDDGLAGIIGILRNKISRLAALSGENRDTIDESLEDTVIDIINYAILFKAVEHEIHVKGKV